ncbi:hypothetical protein ACFV06_33935 [Streptomyces sp. NPDC059618]|uniref:hypothetical protein n=1 Tax=unclassified Streptomyces TaxID=2593676 RepID=UPI0036622EC6
MNGYKKGLALAVTGAALTVGMAAAPASADSYTLYCDTSSSSGAGTINGWASGATSLDVILSVYDAKSDGHNVAIRLIAKNDGGAVLTPWPWHHNYSGYDHSLTLRTTARYSAGMYDVGIEVATFEGDHELNYCRDWLRTGHT